MRQITCIMKMKTTGFAWMLCGCFLIGIGSQTGMAGTANIGQRFRTDLGANGNGGINIHNQPSNRSQGVGVTFTLQSGDLSFGSQSVTNTLELPLIGVLSSNSVPVRIKKVTVFFKGDNSGHFNHSNISLTHGGGKATLYSARQLFYGGGLDLIFDDAATAPISIIQSPIFGPSSGTFRPESPLSVFKAASTTGTSIITRAIPATDARGPWTLEIFDVLGGSSGAYKWGLKIDTALLVFQDSQGRFLLPRNLSKGGLIDSLFATNATSRIRSVTQP